MKLTLSKVHRIIGNLLGGEAVALQNFVSRVEPDSNTFGVILTGTGVLYYNPEWWEEHIDTPEKAKHVIAFEIIKQMLGVARMGKDDWISRVAVGAVVNSYLYNVFGFHELPRAMYSAKNLPECLMRPNARGYHSRLKRVYRGIWKREHRFTSIKNVEQALRILFLDDSLIPPDVDPNQIEVLGYGEGEGGEGQGEEQGEAKQGGTSGDGSVNHGQKTDGKINYQQNHSDRLPSNVMEHVSEGLQQRQAGFSDVAEDYVLQAIKSRKSPEEIMIKDFTLDKIKRFCRKTFEEQIMEESMMPKKLNMRDAFKLAMGWFPPYFENETDQMREERNGGIAVYIDVSGSFEQFIPYTLGVLDGFYDMIEELYQFSNMVDVITRQELRSGSVRINTTGGTDFDCVVRHAIDNGYNKIVIVTDGWADITSEELRQEADQVIEKALVLLVTSLPGNEPLYQDGDEVTGERHGPIYKIENDVVKQRFLDSTWFGQRYGKVAMLSEVFK